MNRSLDQAVALVTRIEELLRRLHALLDEVSPASDLDPVGSEARGDSNVWPEPPPPASFADGGWLGCSIDEAFELKLRIDLALARRLSGDIYRRSKAGRRWFASFSTPPAVPLLPASASWGIVFTRASERQLAEPAGGGTIALSKEDDAISSTESDWTGPALATILTAEPLPGFPTGVTVTFGLKWCGPTLRSIRICRHGSTASSTRLSTRRAEIPRLTMAAKFEAAGVHVEEVAGESFGKTNRLPGQVELLAAGLESAAACRARGQDADLIIVDVPGTARPRLQSVRFPYHAALREPLLAVSGRGGGAKAKIRLHAELQGVAESLGLVRRDTGEAWSSSSVSPMGSPAGYHRGPAAYWRCFGGQFEADELAFLGHAPLPLLGDVGRKVAFGSAEGDAASDVAPFGGAAYWEEWPGVPRPEPFLPERRVELHLGGPSSGRMIHLGQPLFLQFRLLNLSDETLSLEPAVLDPKTCRVNLFARRAGWSRTQLLERRFQPVVQRTHPAAGELIDIRPGETSEAVNIQIGYGTNGPFFPEPGVYEIYGTVDLVEANGVYRVRSAPLRIRIEEPQGREATEEVLQLLEPHAGFWLALGGFEGLSVTGTTLLGIAEQRAARGQADGVVAVIRRAAAIDAGRFYASRSAAAVEAGLERCVELFEVLARDGGLINFDSATSTDTERLWRKQAERLAAARRGQGASRLTKRKPRRRSLSTPSSG